MVLHSSNKHTLLQESKAELTTTATDIFSQWSAIGKAVVRSSNSSDATQKAIKSFVATDDALDRTCKNLDRSLDELTLLLRGTVDTHRLLEIGVKDVHRGIQGVIGVESAANSISSARESTAGGVSLQNSVASKSSLIK